jgi:hypothetical protein
MDRNNGNGVSQPNNNNNENRINNEMTMVSVERKQPAVI